ncbi:MAG: hypothetical protein FJ146_16585 [Deltaproteobacteria bacterium]|nr:hypothetical protein [Deltaproteobacteria bacterium]
MNNRRTIRFYAAGLLAATLWACGSEKVYVTGDSPKPDKSEDDPIDRPMWVKGEATLETVDSKTFEDKIAQRNDHQITPSSAHVQQAGAAHVSVAEVIKLRFLEAQAANPGKFSIDDAQRLAGLVTNYAEAAKRRDVIGAFLIYQNIGREVARIKAAQNNVRLFLYDNSTFSGRILNFGNGIVDVFAQFYASFVALDPSLAVGAGESLVRNITHLITF